ncbi:MAG: hypothetical protein IJP89_04710 [Synergistaceae bacterium]|nr:hypothetical protein [Synergistaceae bacterium]
MKFVRYVFHGSSSPCPGGGKRRFAFGGLVLLLALAVVIGGYGAAFAGTILKYITSEGQLNSTETEDGNIKSVSGNAWPSTLADNDYITVSDTQAVDAITLNNTVNLILYDDASLTVTEGIVIAGGKTLNIYVGKSDASQVSDITGSGALNVTGAADTPGISLASDASSGATVNIYGGVIKVKAGTGANVAPVTTAEGSDAKKIEVTIGDNVKTPESSQTLTYAVTVTFDANGGHVQNDENTTTATAEATFEVKNDTQNPGASEIPTPASTFVKTNYTKVDGWFASASDANAYNASTTPIAKNTTLYAKWTPDTTVWGQVDGDGALDGSDTKPWKISNVEGWNLLAEEVSNGSELHYDNQAFQLQDDITVTTPIGTGDDHAFLGTFDGNTHKITFTPAAAFDTAEGYIAPFAYVKAADSTTATIKNLTVDGTITVTQGTAGGIIGHASGEATVAVEDCAFVGQIKATEDDSTAKKVTAGGFVGANGATTLTISNGLYAPVARGDNAYAPGGENTATFVATSSTFTPTNSYYTEELGTKTQGKQGYTVSGATGDSAVTVALDNSSAAGLTYDNTIYAGASDVLTLTLAGSDTGYTAAYGETSISDESFTEASGKYTLTLPAVLNANVTISAKAATLATIFYVDASGAKQSTTTYTAITDQTTLNAGWYVVNNATTEITNAITVTGAVNLILCDGATLTAKGGIKVEGDGNSLTIYAGTTNSETEASAITGGTLVAGETKTANQAGIGAGTTNTATGNITINGGIITATGGEGAPGIGSVGTVSGTDSSTVTINGGTVTATAGTGDNIAAIQAGTVSVKSATVNSVEYDANSQATYTVIFDANDGKFATTLENDDTTAGFAADGDNLKLTVKVAYGTTPQATAAPKTTVTNNTDNTKTVDFWYPSGTTAGQEEASKVTFPLTLTASATTLMAHWSEGSGGNGDDEDDYDFASLEEPTITHHSMVLGGELSVMFYAYFPEGFASKDYTMSFDVGGDKSRNPTLQGLYKTATVGTTNLYGGQCYITSVQMADTITAELISKDEKTVVFSQVYSADTYLKALVQQNSLGTKAVALGKAIQDYGHYVQAMLKAYHNYGDAHKDMAASGETFSQIEVSTVQNYKIALKKDGNDYTFTTDSLVSSDMCFSLLLSDDTTIRLYMRPRASTTTLTATHNNTTLTPTAVETGDMKGYSYVDINGIGAKDLATTQEVTIKANDTEQFTVNVSALSYVYSVLSATYEANDVPNEATMKNAATAIYKYYAAAKAYADDTTEKPDYVGDTDESYGD